MNARIKKIIKSFSAQKIDALLVTNDTNIKYLTEFPAADSWLLVTHKKTYYITDFRYVLEANKGLNGIPVIQYKESFYKTVFELCKSAKICSLGFDEFDLKVIEHQRLKSATRSIKLVKSYGIVEAVREIKEDSEIRLIKKALKVHEKALKMIKRHIKPGNTEQDVLDVLERFIKRERVGFSFDPIVASGPNSCLPHAHVTRRKIRQNEPVLLDMGIDVSGYKSDLTRMFFLGKISTLVKDINAHVKEAQLRAIAAIKPGVCIAEVDQAARNYLKEQNLSQYFGHALGHGVGLDIHENPRLAGTNTNILREGMVITVEPGVYLPNNFGIRLEEMVLVTAKGKRVLSDYIN